MCVAREDNKHYVDTDIVFSTVAILEDMRDYSCLILFIYLD